MEDVVVAVKEELAWRNEAQFYMEEYSLLLQYAQQRYTPPMACFQADMGVQRIWAWA